MLEASNRLLLDPATAQVRQKNIFNWVAVKELSLSLHNGGATIMVA